MAVPWDYLSVAQYEGACHSSSTVTKNWNTGQSSVWKPPGLWAPWEHNSWTTSWFLAML